MMKLLAALLLTGKLGKVLLTGGTMLVSVLFYAMDYGWKYAVGFVLLIFIHEMGHFIAARNCGLEVGAPVFIPFVGAWVSLKTVDLDPETEAYVGLAGPVLGTLAAFACWLVAEQSGERLWLALAYSGFFLNLFNLIPLRPLDGGRVVRAVSSRLWLLGLPILAALFLWQPSPLILIIGVLALPEVWSSFRGRADDHASIVEPSTRWKYGATYLGLTGALAVLAFRTHERLSAGL